MNTVDGGVWARLVLQATSSLAASTRPIQERVRSAYIDVAPLMGRDFPADLAARWEALREAWTNVDSDDAAVAVVNAYTEFLFSLIVHQDED